MVPRLSLPSASTDSMDLGVRGGPGGGGGDKPNFEPNILDVRTLLFPFSFSASSPHRATTPRKPSPLFGDGTDDVDVPVRWEKEDGG